MAVYTINYQSMTLYSLKDFPYYQIVSLKNTMGKYALVSYVFEKFLMTKFFVLDWELKKFSRGIFV